jgi:hypothetical protein
MSSVVIQRIQAVGIALATLAIRSLPISTLQILKRKPQYIGFLTSCSFVPLTGPLGDSFQWQLWGSGLKKINVFLRNMSTMYAERYTPSWSSLIRMKHRDQYFVTHFHRISSYSKLIENSPFNQKILIDTFYYLSLKHRKIYFGNDPMASHGLFRPFPCGPSLKSGDQGSCFPSHQKQKETGDYLNPCQGSSF